MTIEAPVLEGSEEENFAVEEENPTVEPETEAVKTEDKEEPQEEAATEAEEALELPQLEAINPVLINRLYHQLEVARLEIGDNPDKKMSGSKKALYKFTILKTGLAKWKSTGQWEVDVPELYKTMRATYALDQNAFADAATELKDFIERHKDDRNESALDEVVEQAEAGIKAREEAETERVASQSLGEWLEEERSQDRMKAEKFQEENTISEELKNISRDKKINLLRDALAKSQKREQERVEAYRQSQEEKPERTEGSTERKEKGIAGLISKFKSFFRKKSLEYAPEDNVIDSKTLPTYSYNKPKNTPFGNSTMAIAPTQAETVEVMNLQNPVSTFNIEEPVATPAPTIEEPVPAEELEEMPRPKRERKAPSPESMKGFFRKERSTFIVNNLEKGKGKLEKFLKGQQESLMKGPVSGPEDKLERQYIIAGLEKIIEDGKINKTSLKKAVSEAYPLVKPEKKMIDRTMLALERFLKLM